MVYWVLSIGVHAVVISHATLWYWVTQQSWYVFGLCKDTNQLVLSGTIREPGCPNVFVFVVSAKQLIMNGSGGIILVPYGNPTQTCTLRIWYLQYSSYRVGSLIILLVHVSWGWKVPPEPEMAAGNISVKIVNCLYMVLHSVYAESNYMHVLYYFCTCYTCEYCR